MTEQHYNVHGLRLRVVCGTGVSNPLHGYLAPFVCAAGEPSFMIDIVEGDVAGARAGAKILAANEVAPGVTVEFAVDESRRSLFVAGTAAVVSEPQHNCSTLVLAPESNPMVATYAGIYLMDAALAAGGQVLLHGAALALPEQDHAILMFAQSGAGKTTTSLALALAGFGLMTDDAMVLMPATDRTAPQVWGLPRALKVHRNTRALLPALAPIMGETWDDNGEQPITLKQAGQVMPVRSATVYPVAALIVLMPRQGIAHRLEPMAKSEALSVIARDNLRRTPNGVDTDHQRRFAMLADLITKRPVFSLTAGGSLAALPTALQTGLLAGLAAPTTTQ